ncbi:MAG: hypothetical protein IKN85_00725 [Oscillospiraceae bacterium]|nr:hypothetical protein [Oscillospiraceae bacterium]
MKKVQLYSVIACTALTLFCGCINKNQSSDSSLTAEITTVTETPVTTAISTVTETTEIETTIKTSIETTITTAASTEVHTTEPEETTVTTTEARVFEHHYEIINTAFRTRPVNERCMKLYEEQSEYLSENVRRAIEENREVYGTVKKWCFDKNTNCIYALVGYDLKWAFNLDLSIYKIDMNTGETSWVCDTAEPDDDVSYGPLAPESSYQNVYVFMEVYGKIIYDPYNGLYYVDDDNHCLQSIEQRYSEQANCIALSDNKMYIQCTDDTNGEFIPIKEVYDPRTNTMEPTALSASRDFDQSRLIMNIMLDRYYHNSTLSYEGNINGEHKIIFDWNTVDLPD